MLSTGRWRHKKVRIGDLKEDKKKTQEEELERKIKTWKGEEYRGKRGEGNDGRGRPGEEDKDKEYSIGVNEKKEEGDLQKKEDKDVKI